MAPCSLVSNLKSAPFDPRSSTFQEAEEACRDELGEFGLIRHAGRTLHEEEGEAVRFRARKPSAPGLADLNERLSDRLDTRVRVTLGKSKGKISVEFASLDDLRRIVEIMDPRNREDRSL